MSTIGKHFGLIGHPIEHSQSPQLFQEAHPNSPDIYDLIQTPDFEEAYDIFQRDYDAVNVTAPFKELAFEKADIKEPTCALIGATNLLRKEGPIVKAYNTDMTAVMRCLWRGFVHQINSGIWKPERTTGEIQALVIGVGGAGKAATIACLNLGFKTSIANRTRPRTFEFIDHISAYRKILPEAVDYFEIGKAIKQSDIIIYAIPEPIPDLLHADLSGKIILEANYRTPSIPPSITHSTLPNTTLYLDGIHWLRAQAQATWRLL